MANTYKSNLTVVDNSDSEPLKLLQEQYALSTIGGAIHVLNRVTLAKVLAGHPTAQVEYIKKADADVIMKRFIESLPLPLTRKQAKAVIDEWWFSPDTTVYARVTFTPNPVSDETLNLWIAPTIKPKKGNWDIIRDYLRYVICDGDEVLFEYIGNFLVHALKHPEEKPGIIIVLMGDEGVGKGFFLRLIARIWGSTTIEVSDMSKVVGTFNKDIENKYWILLDEALFKGDKKSQDRLKSLITEPTVQVEQKYEPSRTVESVHRFVATTNHDQFAQIRVEDRRCVFVRVSNKHKQDTKYFAKLDKAFNDGETVEAFAYHLMECDISAFNPRARPPTTETVQQKIRSLTGFNRYWYEVLHAGNFYFKESHQYQNDTGWYEPAHIANSHLLNLYREYDKTAERHEPMQLQTVKEKLRLICPSAQGKRVDNKRCLSYPHIDAARKEFEEFIGCEIDWPE